MPVSYEQNGLLMLFPYFILVVDCFNKFKVPFSALNKD